MEKGFFHPDRGYWQTTGDVPQKVKATYPEGTVEVSVKPSANHEFDKGEWKLDPAKVKADKDAKDAVKAKEDVGKAAATLVRGSVSEADFIAAIKWALRQ